MNATQPAQPVPTPAPFQSASLYVGDLHNEVSEVIEIRMNLFILISLTVFVYL